MQADEELKVLIIHDDKNEANRIASLLRNAKYKVASTHTNTPDALIKLLEDKPFDLILAEFECAQLPGKNIFPHLRRLNLDLPIIQISADTSFEKMAEGMRLGSFAVIPMDEDQVLLLALSRVLYNLGQRRKLRYWRRRYNESETRCQRLMESSRDAIAIIQDGAYLFCNEVFAKLFGFIDPDGMMCLPVIDTIAPEDRARLKKILKPIVPDSFNYREELIFTGITCDDVPIPIACTTSHVDYQGEPALEFLIPSSLLLGNDVAEIIHYNESCASIQRQRTLEHIDNAINRAASLGKLSTLIYITIDRYHTLEQEIGYQIMEKLVADLINYLEGHIKDPHTIDRFKEESLILLLNGGHSDHALQMAENLCAVVREHPPEVGDQTFNITLSIGVSIISETATSPEGCIFRCLNAITALQDEQKADEYGNGARLYEAPENSTAKPTQDIETRGQEILEKNQFDLFYQPIISLHGDQGEFYEVLLRVEPTEEQPNLPEDFIDKLFRSKLSDKIDRWVIIESVKKLGIKLNTNPQTQLFVNLSGRTIRDTGFIPWLKAALKASNIPPKHLVFQVREIDIGRHQQQATQLINDLKAINSGVALSHFGLAIDPLQLLKNLPFDYIKFDSLVIEKTQRNEQNHMEEIEPLVNSLKTIDGQIIIPFVEHAAMIPELWHYGIHYIQGHFLQPPLPDMDYDFDSEN